MLVVLNEDNGFVRTLLLTDKAPLVLGPGQTLVPQYDGYAYPCISSLCQFQRADGFSWADQSTHVAVLIAGSMPQIHPGGPETLQARAIPVWLQGVRWAGPHALAAASAAP